MPAGQPLSPLPWESYPGGASAMINAPDAPIPPLQGPATTLLEEGSATRPFGRLDQLRAFLAQPVPGASGAQSFLGRAAQPLQQFATRMGNTSVGRMAKAVGNSGVGRLAGTAFNLAAGAEVGREAWEDADAYTKDLPSWARYPMDAAAAGVGFGAAMTPVGKVAAPVMGGAEAAALWATRPHTPGNAQQLENDPRADLAQGARASSAEAILQAVGDPQGATPIALAKAALQVANKRRQSALAQGATEAVAKQLYHETIEASNDLIRSLAHHSGRTNADTSAYLASVYIQAYDELNPGKRMTGGSASPWASRTRNLGWQEE